MTLKEFQAKLRKDGYANYAGARRAAGKHGFSEKEKALAHKAIDRKYGKAESAADSYRRARRARSGR